MRRPAQLNLPGRFGSRVKFSSTVEWFIGRKKVRRKPVSRAPICLFSQLNSRTLGAVRSPLRSSSPIKTLNINIRKMAVRSMGCLNGRIPKNEGLNFLLKIFTNCSLLFLVKNHCPIFPLKFYIPRRTPVQKPNLAIQFSYQLRLTIVAKTVRSADFTALRTNPRAFDRHPVPNS